MDISVENATSPLRRMAEPSRLSPVVFCGIAGTGELALTAASGLALAYFYVGALNGLTWSGYFIALAIAWQVQYVLFKTARLYRLAAFRQPSQKAGRILVAWSILFAVLVVIAFAFKVSELFSRVWLFGWYASGYGFLLLYRFALARIIASLTRSGRLMTHVVIVGGDERGKKLIQSLESSLHSEIKICGVFDDRADRVGPRVCGYPVLGTVKSLLAFARARRVDLLIVSLPFAAERRIVEVIKQLYELPVDIRLAAHHDSLRFAPHAYSYVAGVPMLDVTQRPVADWDLVVKAIEDRVLAALFLLLSLPLFAIIGIAIKLDSKGPVFFKQKRYGFNNELIEVYKFRSLRHELSDKNAEKLVAPGDPRVTRVGKFLRRSSIDELPQLLSVLKGGMSIVGPRPHATAAKAGDRLYQEVADGYYARHRVKPGITGWAQINGWRGDTDTEEKLLKRTEHDLYYIDNWSLWFDLFIIAHTPWALLKGTNAH
jgi:Undecaprenyl-phosphate glucose phosphotransferase